MKRLLVLASAVLLFAGCASFSTNTFRAEQTATDLAYTAYVGWQAYLTQYPVTPEASNSVKVARLKFASTVGVIEALRASYETNSAVKTQIEAALLTANDQASNVVWLINFWEGAGK